jgi:hypothetical protein
VLEPWTGDLEQLSAEYRDRWLKGGPGAGTGVNVDPDESSIDGTPSPPGFGQLRITPRDDDDD